MIARLHSASTGQNAANHSGAIRVRRFLLSAFCLFLPSLAAADDAPIKPFTAEYQTLRNGKELASTTLELTRMADGTYRLRTNTRGTSGLAKMSGLDVLEESSVRWIDGKPETLRYEFTQEVAFGDKHRLGEFDHANQQVRMIDGKSDARYPLVPWTIERHALTLALAADLSRDATTFEYKVAGKKGIEDVRYTRCGTQNLSVPAGNFEASCLERVREKRSSRSWFAPILGWLPIIIEQVEKKGDTVTLKLVSSKPAVQAPNP